MLLLKDFIEKNTILAISISFIILNLWKPFFLGFYADDWNYYILLYDELSSFPVFSFDFFNPYLSAYANRPVIGLLTWFFAAIFGKSIVGWNFAALLIVLANTISLYLFAKYIFLILRLDNVGTITFFTVLLWLLSPWSLGMTAWPVGSTCLPSMTFFLLSGFVFFRSWHKEKPYIILPSILFLLSCLTYESYYFQFIFIIGIYFILGFHKKFTGRYTILMTTFLVSAQALSVIWNRTVYLFLETHSVNKPLNPVWFETFLANILSYPYSLFSSFGIFMPLAIILFLAGLIILFKATPIDRRSDISIRLLISLLGLLFLCILISLFTYSLAGYTIWGMGARSRTTMSNGFFALLAFIILLVYAEKKILSKNIKGIAISLIVLSFAGANLSRTYDWLKAWEIQKDVISSLPVEKLRETDKDALIIVDAPFFYNWVPVFNAEWAIDIQFNQGYKIITGNDVLEKDSLHRTYIMGRNIIHSYYNAPWVNEWDGKKLIQKYDIPETTKLALTGYKFNRLLETYGTELWLWNYEAGTFNKIEAPAKIQLQQIRNYDYWLTSLWNDHIKKILGRK